MHVFLSFHPDSKQDQEVAGHLFDLLRQHRITPVSVNLRGTYGDKILAGLRKFPYRIDYFVVLLSKSYLESAWHHLELAAFLMYEERRHRRGRMIVPVVLDGGAIHPLLVGRPPACRIEPTNIARPCADLLKHLHGAPRPKPKVFVVMKLGDDALNHAYHTAMVPAIQAAGFKPIRIDQYENAENVPVKILNRIDTSDVVLADMTGERPNCYFEAGYARGLGKELILTVRRTPQTALGLHFDLAGNRFIVWSSVDELKEQLTRRFNAIRERDRRYRKRSDGTPPPSHGGNGAITPSRRRHLDDGQHRGPLHEPFRPPVERDFPELRRRAVDD